MSKKHSLLYGPYLLWTAAFILIPLLLILYYGLTNADGSFTFSNIMEMGRPENLKALYLSLLLSLISTLICLILAYPLAMILRDMQLHATGLIVMIFIIPMWMNFLLRTLAWQTLLEKTGVINSVLKYLHLPTLNIINTPYAIVDLFCIIIETFHVLYLDKIVAGCFVFPVTIEEAGACLFVLTDKVCQIRRV